jgi:N-acetylglutamate synthase-like GNAT family acetyltransferase
MTRPSPTPSEWRPRLAREDDIVALAELIPLSVRKLQLDSYSSAQMETAIATSLFGVDRQLIRDGTYFVVEHDGQIVGCGGWSKRSSKFGGDPHGTRSDAELDPRHDAARIRAFFVHPMWARRGIGRSIMAACEEAIITAGFRRVEIVATLAGEPLYAALGYAVVERFDIRMTTDVGLPVVRMTKRFDD